LRIIIILLLRIIIICEGRIRSTGSAFFVARAVVGPHAFVGSAFCWPRSARMLLLARPLFHARAACENCGGGCFYGENVVGRAFLTVSGIWERGATLGTACVEFIQTGEEKIMHGGVKIIFLRPEKNFSNFGTKFLISAQRKIAPRSIGWLQIISIRAERQNADKMSVCGPKVLCGQRKPTGVVVPPAEIFLVPRNFNFGFFSAQKSHQTFIISNSFKSAVIFRHKNQEILKYSQSIIVIDLYCNKNLQKF
jgi:hypothetical protein